MKQGNYALDVSLALLLADEDTDEDADEEEEALSEALSLFFSAAEEGSGGVSGVALGATGLTTSDALSGVGGTDSWSVKSRPSEAYRLLEKHYGYEFVIAPAGTPADAARTSRRVAYKNE